MITETIRKINAENLKVGDQVFLGLETITITDLDDSDQGIFACYSSTSLESSKVFEKWDWYRMDGQYFEVTPLLAAFNTKVIALYSKCTGDCLCKAANLSDVHSAVVNFRNEIFDECSRAEDGCEIILERAYDQLENDLRSFGGAVQAAHDETVEVLGKTIPLLRSSIDW